MAEITRTGMRIQARGDTKAQWESKNPILLDREIGYVTKDENNEPDGRYKIGDGSKPWKELPYANDEGLRYKGRQDIENPLDNLVTDPEKGDVYQLFSTRGCLTTTVDGKKAYPGALVIYNGTSWEILANGIDERTTLADYGITDAVSKEEYANALSGMYVYKGTCTVDELPTKAKEPNLKTGWVYNIKVDSSTTDGMVDINVGTEHKDSVTNGDNVAWVDEDGGYWDKLANVLDLNGFKWFQRVEIQDSLSSLSELSTYGFSNSYKTKFNKAGLYYVEATDGNYIMLVPKDGQNGILFTESGNFSVDFNDNATSFTRLNDTFFTNPKTINLSNFSSTTSTAMSSNRIIKSKIETPYYDPQEKIKNSNAYIFDGMYALTPYGITSYVDKEKYVRHPPIIELYWDKEADVENYNNLIFEPTLLYNQIYKITLEETSGSFYIMKKNRKSDNKEQWIMFGDCDTLKAIGLTEKLPKDENYHLLISKWFEPQSDTAYSINSIPWTLFDNGIQQDKGLTTKDILHKMFQGYKIVCNTDEFSNWQDVADEGVSFKSPIPAADPASGLYNLIYSEKEWSDQDIIVNENSANISSLGGISLKGYIGGHGESGMGINKQIGLTLDTTQSIGFIDLDNFNITTFNYPNSSTTTSITLKNCELPTTFTCGNFNKITLQNCAITGNYNKAVTLDFSKNPAAAISLDNLTMSYDGTTGNYLAVVKLPDYNKTVPRIKNCSGFLIQTADGNQYLSYEAYGSDTKGVIIAVDLLGDVNFLPYDLGA